MNKAYSPCMRNNKRYEVLYGGAGSGKSVFTAQKIVLKMLAEKGHKWLIARKVARTNRHSTFSLIRSIIVESELSHLFSTNKSEMEITAANGNQILFAGLDDVEKLKSIAGITNIWIEEASEISEDDFNQLDLRLRGQTRHAKQIALTFNPVSAQSWLKKRFFDVEDEQVMVLKTTYKNNPFIDEEYKKVLEKLKHQDPIYYKIYALGEWGALGNLILTNWQASERIYQDENYYDQVLCGMDFGFNHASAFLKVGLKDGDIYIFDEVYEKGLTNPELIELVKEKANKNNIIYADSAEPARILEFKRAGLNVKAVKKGQDSVRNGIEFLRRHRILIHSSCVNTISEIQSWKYKEDKNGNVLEEPVPFKDDAMAALRYAVESLAVEKEKTKYVTGREYTKW
jgi:phage terminase large subunit